MELFVAATATLTLLKQEVIGKTCYCLRKIFKSEVGIVYTWTFN